jgi:hypothetical protein
MCGEPSGMSVAKWLNEGFSNKSRNSWGISFIMNTSPLLFEEMDQACLVVPTV